MPCQSNGSSTRNNNKNLLRRFLVITLAAFLISQPAIAYEQEVTQLSVRMAEAIAKSGRKTVAVVDFTDLQGNVTELGRFLAEEVSVALANSAKDFEVIDRTNIKSLLQEHKLASTGIIDPQTARRLGEIAGVQVLVTGTITPFGDSVRLSAKVLDSATAKVLSGFTADIPRTKAIEELLAKGVSSAGGASSNSHGSSTDSGGTNGTAERQPSIATASARIGDFSFSVQSCRKAGQEVECSGVVVNKSNQRQRLRIDSERTYMVDNLGNQTPSHGMGWKVKGRVGSSALPYTTEVEPDLPMTFSITSDGISEGAASISLVLVMREPTGQTTLRNISLQNR